MTMKCLACGARKDPGAREVYPYSGDGIVIDAPVF